MKGQIASSVVFDQQERPLHATIITSTETVKVEWSDVAGDWCWITSGTLEAKKMAVLAIERLQRMISVLD